MTGEGRGKQGLSHLFKISCRNISCRWDKTFFTSKEVKKDGRGSKPFGVNLRSIIAFRDMGKGHAGLETFCGYMNMPPPMAEMTYNNTTTCTLYNVYKEVASSDMQDAGRSLRETIQECFSEEEVCDTPCDGTRRGYASLNGVITSISVETGKCLAYQCLVKNCKPCEMWVSR